jgi:hypothetical protein
VSGRRGYIVLFRGCALREESYKGEPRWYTDGITQPVYADWRGGTPGASVYRTAREARGVVVADIEATKNWRPEVTSDDYRIVAVALPTDRARGGR